MAEEKLKKFKEEIQDEGNTSYKTKTQDTDIPKHPTRKLSVQKLERIRELRKQGYSLRQIKKLLPDVSKSTISKYIRDITITEHQKEQLEKSNQQNRLKNYNSYFKPKKKKELEEQKKLPKIKSSEIYKKVSQSHEVEQNNFHNLSINLNTRKDSKKRHKGVKLSHEKIEQIRNLREKGYSIREIKKEIPSISTSTISKYIRDIKLTKNKREELEHIPKWRKIWKDKLDAIIKQRGGKWNPKEYISKRIKVKIECKEGHIFEALPYHIAEKKGAWCPECSEGKSERVCRTIFETIFGEEFPKDRPEWLINDRGNQMELDGYNKKLALAFEYQGHLHYYFIGFFHESKKKFNQRVSDDKKKRELCKNMGITLIEVPYTVKYEQMPDYIIRKCKENKISIPEIGEIDIREIINRSIEKLEDIKGSCQKKIDNYVINDVKD